MTAADSRTGGCGCVRVEVVVEGLGERLAESLAESLRPDDATAPRGLRVWEEARGPDLLLGVEGCGRWGTVKNTVDEMLEFLYAALRAVEEAARREERVKEGG